VYKILEKQTEQNRTEMFISNSRSAVEYNTIMFNPHLQFMLNA